MPSETVVRPSRIVRKFTSFAEQEQETLEYWFARTPAERLEEAGNLSRHAYSFRDRSQQARPFTHLPPVYDSDGREIPPSRVVRKFSSFEEQTAWNDANAWAD